MFVAVRIHEGKRGPLRVNARIKAKSYGNRAAIHHLIRGRSCIKQDGVSQRGPRTTKNHDGQDQYFAAHGNLMNPSCL
jgi:hypothetical protein